MELKYYYRYGLVPSSPLVVSPLQPGQQASTSVPMSRTGQPSPMNPANMIQIAVKNNSGVYYFVGYVDGDVISA